VIVIAVHGLVSCSSSEVNRSTDRSTTRETVATSSLPVVTDTSTSAIPATSMSVAVAASNGCTASSIPISVVKAFISAAKEHDGATLARCTFDAAPLAFDPVSGVAMGGWLVDQARVDNKFTPTTALSAAAVVYDIPLPPQSRGTEVVGGSVVEGGPPYQGGMFVAIDKRLSG
jgi:hypothetical protein